MVGQLFHIMLLLLTGESARPSKDNLVTHIITTVSRVPQVICGYIFWSQILFLWFFQDLYVWLFPPSVLFPLESGCAFSKLRKEGWTSSNGRRICFSESSPTLHGLGLRTSPNERRSSSSSCPGRRIIESLCIMYKSKLRVQICLLFSTVYCDRDLQCLCFIWSLIWILKFKTK